MAVRRIERAVLDRIRALPHNVAYTFNACPGSVDYARLAQFASVHRGERPYALGNGPSLARTDLSRIHGDQTNGVNHIFLMFDQVPFRPTYCVRHGRADFHRSSERITQL